MSEIPVKLSALYISHGGGPMPLLGDDGHREMVAHLSALATRITKPSAILVISAHWEEQVVTITHSTKPPIIYDYYGFPAQTYEIQYPAPGAPALAQSVHAKLLAHGIEAKLDDERGFDHGLYVPLSLMYPQADVPCIQVSLVKSLDAREHIRIGEALSDLAKEDVLILGSGFSFHNMRAFATEDTPESTAKNEAFEEWLIATCSSQSLDEATRADRLTNWESAPFARYCHPREEHLLPLHVCYGATRRPCSAYLSMSIMNKKASFYFW